MGLGCRAGGVDRLLFFFVRFRRNPSPDVLIAPFFGPPFLWSALCLSLRYAGLGSGTGAYAPADRLNLAAGRTIPAPRRFPRPRLCAYTGRDEAWLGLRANELLTSIPRNFEEAIHALGKSLWPTSMLFLGQIVLIYAGLVTGVLASPLWIGVMAGLGLGLVSTLATYHAFRLVRSMFMMLNVLAVSLVRGNPLIGHGWYGPVQSLLTDVRVTRLPTGLDVDEARNYHASMAFLSHKLRHSFFYTDPEVVAQLCEWIGKVTRDDMEST